jgi:chromosome segregation ATPase
MFFNKFKTGINNRIEKIEAYAAKIENRYEKWKKFFESVRTDHENHKKYMKRNEKLLERIHGLNFERIESMTERMHFIDQSLEFGNVENYKSLNDLAKLPSELAAIKQKSTLPNIKTNIRNYVMQVVKQEMQALKETQSKEETEELKSAFELAKTAVCIEELKEEKAAIDRDLAKTEDELNGLRIENGKLRRTQHILQTNCLFVEDLRDKIPNPNITPLINFCEEQGLPHGRDNERGRFFHICAWAIVEGIEIKSTEPYLKPQLNGGRPNVF